MIPLKEPSVSARAPRDLASISHASLNLTGNTPSPPMAPPRSLACPPAAHQQRKETGPMCTAAASQELSARGPPHATPPKPLRQLPVQMRRQPESQSPPQGHSKRSYHQLFHPKAKVLSVLLHHDPCRPTSKETGYVSRTLISVRQGSLVSSSVNGVIGAASPELTGCCVLGEPALSLISCRSSASPPVQTSLGVAGTQSGL